MNFAGEVGQQAQKPDDGVAEEKVPTQALVSRRDSHLDAHSSHDQGLVIAEAQSEEEEDPVQVTAAVRPVHPHEQQTEHAHEVENGQGIHLDNHALAPDESIEAQQRSADPGRHEGDGVFRASRQVFEQVDALEDQAGSAGDEQRGQTGRKRSGHGRGNRHPPSDAREREDLGEEPGVDRPHRITGRVGDARIHRAHSQFTGVFQRQVGSDGVQVTGHDKQRHQDEGQPVHGTK